MLESLTIKDFIIVDELEVSLKTGFSVLTGETGAGKSILIDALSLCLGQRSDPSLVRKNKEKADIIATFNIEKNASIKSWLQEKDLLSDEYLILRRVIQADGKSKAFINGVPTILSDLKSVGEQLVDIYSQNFHYSLLKPSSQRDILDNFANTKKLAEEVAQKFNVWHQISIEHERFLENQTSYLNELQELEQKDKEYELLEFSLEEWEQIQSQHKMMSNSSELIHGIKEALNIIENDSALSIRQQLNQLKNSLYSLTKFDAEIQQMLKTVESLAIELVELEKDLEHRLHVIDINESDKVLIENKLKNTFDFLRKYNISADSLEEYSIGWKERITFLRNLTQQSNLEASQKEARVAFDNLAKLLTEKRSDAALKLSQQITERLNSLSFEGAKFEVTLTPCEPTSYGNEKIDFLIATYKGADLRPIGKVASGGELSRISLAIRVSSISDSDVPVMIFDEVDVGIGGGVAETIGLLLKSLGQTKDKQVFVITHLPQVAAQSRNHYKVLKSIKNNEAISHIQFLDDDLRVKELARMLGGIEISDKTLAHARELLG